MSEHPEQTVVRTFTVFVCPECGYWHGEREGLWSKPSRCSACIRRVVAAKPSTYARRYTTMSDVAKAPMTEAVEVEAR